jgi:hypothetical protein
MHHASLWVFWLAFVSGMASGLGGLGMASGLGGSGLASGLGGTGMAFGFNNQHISSFFRNELNEDGKGLYRKRGMTLYRTGS